MRKFSLLVVLALVLSVFGIARAQGPVFCGDLAEAECNLLKESEAAMAKVTSASLELNAVINIEGASPMEIKLDAKGAYSVGAAMPATMGSNMVDNLKALVGYLKTFKGDLTLNLSLPAAMAGNLPSPLTIQVRWVDGVGFINFDTISALLNNPQLKGWGGLDIASLLEEVLKNEQLVQMLETQGSSAMGGFSPEMIQKFSDPATVGKFVKLSKGEGAEGKTVIVGTVDFKALFALPEMAEIMKAQMKAQAPTMTDEQITQALQMTTAMMEGFTFSTKSVINNETKYQEEVSFEFALGGAAMASAGGGGVKGSFSVKLADFNAAPAIAAPEGAQILPYQQLLQMMGGMMAPGVPGMMATPTPAS